jgi:hypothetical protein
LAAHGGAMATLCLVGAAVCQIVERMRFRRR